MESIKRTEYHLCSRLGMKPGMRALDVGCGVGGPMRNMAIFSGSHIDGISINQYQVRSLELCSFGARTAALEEKLPPTS
eukprot:54271-Eustigmatos_ZCMA.PRE.1